MRVQVRFFSLIAFLLIILSNQTFTQTYIPDNIRFKNVTRELGLSNGLVESILQDSRGFLWVVTMDGLNRYEGRRVKVFKYLLDDSNSFGSNTVLALYEDKFGILWIETEEGGLNRYNREPENFIRYIINPDNCPNVTNTALTIYEDSYGV